MALEEYRQKRDFGKTSEPPPGVIKPRKDELSYLIQKHDATRLHYDFRLELNGVLLSWAVTKGPSLDPADKRLAVRTEDHPLSYGTFEGTIPKGQYGGGTVMLWDKGTWEPKGDPGAGLQKGHLSFTLHGERLKGDWDLVRMHGDARKENWLLIKAKDAEARANGQSTGLLDDLAYSVATGRSMDAIAAGERPAPRRRAAATEKPAKPVKNGAATQETLSSLEKQYPAVQLATLVDAPPEGEQWLHEIKFDGYRLLGFLSGGEVRLRTRNGLDWTSKFPQVASTIADLRAKDAVLDMEAVVLDEQGKSGFQALQEALGEGGRRDRIVAYTFDLLHLDGENLTRLMLTERKDKLAKLLKSSKARSALRFSDHVTGNGSDMLAKACKLGLEGIISKRADAPYTAGRDKNWLKAKCQQRQEFIIIGYSNAKSGGRALGALYLGYHRGGALTYAGKVGTGFTMKSALALTQKLEKLAVEKPVLDRKAMSGPGASEFHSIHWVKPVLLCEVTFTEWTGDGRIRHPSFQGLREDKKAAEVKMEKPQAVRSVPKSSPLKLPLSKGLVLEGITITHPDRVISETGQITKGELADYHAAVAPYMLPRLLRHPLSLLRCPSGIGNQCFYQRNPGRGLGADVKPFKFRHKGKNYEYLYIEDLKGLLEIIQMGAIEIHPWGASVDNIDHPDRMTFDLDPAPDVPFAAVKLAAQDLKTRLKRRGLECMLKCTGGKGLHVTVPLAEKDDWDRVKTFAAGLAHEMVEAVPAAYVATMTKAKRNGKIFIDFFRNEYTATAIADYAVRARPGAPVALPLSWKELDDLESGSQFTMKDVLARLKRKKPVAVPAPQRLPRS
ncbi:MAG TPA: DNA ligase D [Bryobacteraceae bacterium]|nr:DNA ligase D [Bryobacteraceae bacterium]